MYVPRVVHARLVERLIFNFRLRPDALAEHLPTSWLHPQTVNGWSVVSFCILSLDRMMLAPLPGSLGYSTISCAYRIGVMDRSSGTPEPSVYITDRNTDLPLIARLAPFLFVDTIPMVRPTIQHYGEAVNVQITYLDRQRLFSVRAKPGPLRSEVFGSVEEFAAFIRGGVSSYTPSIFGDRLARVDLVKEEVTYQPLEATVEHSWLDGVWRDAGMVYDSAVRARGGRYRWTYRGLRSYS